MSQKILEERRSYDFLPRGWHTTESQANFIFTEPVKKGGKSGKETAQSLYQYLEKNNIFVRYFPNHRLTQSKIRISIGTQNNEHLFQHIKQWQDERS